MSRQSIVVVSLLVLLMLGSMHSGILGQGGPLFVDITDQALGPARLTHAGASVDFFPCQPNPFPQPGPPLSLLGGVVIADLNGDGWNDIFVTNGGGSPNVLYLNNADGVPTFREVAEVAGVADSESEAVAAVAGDVDNDGDMDLYVSNVGLPPGLPNPEVCPPVEGLNRLFINQGNDEEGIPRFVDMAAEVGAAGHGFTRSQSPSLVDFDMDGDVDIFVAAHHPVVIPFFPSDSPMYPPRPPFALNLLLRNDLRETGQLSFTDVSDLLRNETSGTVGRNGQPIFDSRITYDGVWIDYDGDGDPDLIEANELGELGVYRNNGSGPFTYVTPALGLNDVLSSRGIAPGDVNGDGNIDFFVTSIGLFAAQAVPTFTNPRHGLYLSDGRGGLTDVAAAVGVANPPVDGDETGDSGWGAVMFDYDNDGDLDLFFAGNWFPAGFGIVEPFDFPTGGHTNHAHLFENLGTDEQGNPILRDRLATVDQRAAAGIDNPFDARGVAVGDLDGDGFQDIVIVNVSGFATQGTCCTFNPIAPYTGRVVIYKNKGNAHRTLIIRLRGSASSRDGLGARVTVVTDRGTQVREARAGEGHYSQSSPELEFGLGEAQRVQRIEIQWPSGRRQIVDGVALTRQVTRLEIQEP